MPTALIIGASRGIGHELAQQYLKAGWRVIATARKAEDCDALTALGAEPHQLDVTNADGVAALGWKLDGELLDVAILNAGVYGPKHDGFPTQQDFDSVMRTNVLAAMWLMPVIAPMVAEAQGRLAVISSKMGSMGERSSPNGSLYRASKAALNSVLVDTSLAYGPKGAICVAFHPGWVRTDMGGKDADLSPEQSAKGIRQTLAGLKPADNGSYLNYDGTAIAW
jgi:NAD(P)-dependent dehydrogenase (short-subunit alcohol dehydrogenase family)